MIDLQNRETHSHAACFGREHWFKKATEIGFINSAPGICNRNKDEHADTGFVRAAPAQQMARSAGTTDTTAREQDLSRPHRDDGPARVNQSH
jgi:hypothetical protein